MILDTICAHKRLEVDAQKTAVPLRDLDEALSNPSRPLRDFRQALRAPGISLIAEFKRHSPSKGMLMADLDPAEVAGAYEASGARAISVLTDTEFFKGTFDDLFSVRQNVAIPCLQKDFIIDEYQIYEARTRGADAILLIVRILSDQQIVDYLALARALGMCALVETHSAAEIDRAIETGARIIGINNRNLDTFEVDINTTMELRKRVPGGKTLVSESGIFTRDHVRKLEDGGVDAILVGEALVTSRNIRGKIRELMGRDEG
jgi:indole-3-glycerol phosphate synthase